MGIRKLGRGLFYSRDSEGRSEMTPSQYVDWARRKCAELKVKFSGTSDEIDNMIRRGDHNHKDIYFDNDISGNILHRPGLNALLKAVENDESISHVFIPRRDRLARPNDAVDGYYLEMQLRRHGVTIVLMSDVLEPIERGARADIGDAIKSMIEYDRSGQERRDLAQKMIYAQINLAKQGFSTGGRARYGFRRWLVSPNGEPIQELQDGEIVRRSGHHVVWLPGPEDELAIIRRIIDQLPSTPARRIATELTAEGIPAPDTGRFRTTNGTKHPVSGVWHGTTINNIARSPLLIALVEYGRRGMGDQLRATPTGPRMLNDEDYRLDSPKPKVVVNPQEDRVRANAAFEPFMSSEAFACLQDVLNARAGKQRGVPRHRHTASNFLGCRIFDLDCGYPMYRIARKNGYIYRCGLYQQSHSQKCNHNCIDGLLAVSFALSCIHQRVCTPTMREKIRIQLEHLAAKEMGGHANESTLKAKQAEVARLELELKSITKNLARAESDELFQLVAAEHAHVKDRLAILRAELASTENEGRKPRPSQAEADKAMAVIDHIFKLAETAQNGKAVKELFDVLNVRMYLRFQRVQAGKRMLNKLASGLLTFGATSPPIALYRGPEEERRATASATPVTEPSVDRQESAGTCETFMDSGRGEVLSINANRGDRI